MPQVSNVAAEDEDDATWRENCQRLLDLVPDERQSAALSMGPIRCKRGRAAAPAFY
jgi:hypothetical protein